MWNTSKSLTLSIIVTRLLMALVLFSVFFIPSLGQFYLELRAVNIDWLPHLIVPLYLCVPPVSVALISLDRMLARIKRDIIFVQHNVRSIRIISWCCIIVGLITGVSACLYPPFIFIMIVMLFCGLISRVIKNVFLEAVTLQNENDYTI